MNSVTSQQRAFASLLEASSWVLLLQVPAVTLFEVYFSAVAPVKECKLFSLRSGVFLLENIALLWGIIFFATKPVCSKIPAFLLCLTFGISSSWFTQRYYIEAAGLPAWSVSEFSGTALWLFYIVTCIQGFAFWMASLLLKFVTQPLDDNTVGFFWHKRIQQGKPFASLPLVVFAFTSVSFLFLLSIAWVAFSHHNNIGPFAISASGDVFGSFSETSNSDANWLLIGSSAGLFSLLVLLIFFINDFFHRKVELAEAEKTKAELNEQWIRQTQVEFKARLSRALGGRDMGMLSWVAQPLQAHCKADPLSSNSAELYFELSSLKLMKQPDPKTRGLQAFFAQWVLEEDLDATMAALSEFFQGCEETLKLEFRALLNDESVGCFSFTANLTRNAEDQSPVFLDGFIANVTQDVMALASLRKVSESRMQTIFAVSHDVGSPLGLIQMTAGFLTSLLKREGSYSAQAGRFLLRIDASVKEAHAYLNNALSMAKTGDPDFRFESVKVNMHGLIKKIVEAQAPMYGFDLKNLELDLSHDGCFEAIQEFPLQMIFSNLISNAFKYTGHEDAKVSIRLYAHPGGPNPCNTPRTVIEVQDNGIGISDSLKSTLFKPFCRGGNVDDIKGTGLGLTVVKRATAMLNAELELVPTPQGTCFRLTVPHALVMCASGPASS